MKSWSGDEVLELIGRYQPAAVLVAAAELDVFTVLRGGPRDAAAVAARTGADVRAITVLLDALAALSLLVKEVDRYALAPGVADCLAEGAPRSVLSMARHQGNCLRRWAVLAEVAKTGLPAPRPPSVRGAPADLASFIGAMDEVSRAQAPAVIAAVDATRFRRILDVGGASGTWTMEFLRAAPSARAILFDLPDVIPLARERLAGAGLLERVDLVPGDFYEDPMPPGADLVWLGAIVHQNSREENRALFRKAHAALLPGGEIAVRDIVMETDRIRPPAGALFAVNMLVGTRTGGTYTFEELRDDLSAAGFLPARLVRKGQWMDSVVMAARES